MKMKRRWKAILGFSLVFVILGVIAIINPDVRWLFAAHFIGFITGLIVYSAGMLAEEREKREWKFQDDVFAHYESLFDLSIDREGRDEDAINDTAIHFDISPSQARNIVNIYVGHNGE